MARPKSTSGKVNRASINPEQTPEQTQEQTQTQEQVNNKTTAANLPDVKAAAGGTTPAEVAAAEVRTAPEPRKLEVVKSEPRKNSVAPNLVPIHLENEIRRRAYELYVQRGSTGGSEAEDWLNAEREIRQRYLQQSA
jgi:hypothetical protein